MTLENLVRIGRLKPHEPSRAEIVRLLAAAERNLRDARVRGVSTETRFDAAYKAGLQCGLVALLARGFRPSTGEPGHHATVIQSLATTIGITSDRLVVLDKLRRRRNLSDYGGEGHQRNRDCVLPARRRISARQLDRVVTYAAT
jgi:hypothetical protein